MAATLSRPYRCPVIVDNAVYRAGVRVPLDCDIADLATVRGQCAPR